MSPRRMMVKPRTLQPTTERRFDERERAGSRIATASASAHAAQFRAPGPWRAVSDPPTWGCAPCDTWWRPSGQYHGQNATGVPAWAAQTTPAVPPTSAPAQASNPNSDTSSAGHTAQRTGQSQRAEPHTPWVNRPGTSFSKMPGWSRRSRQRGSLRCWRSSGNASLRRSKA